MTGFTHNHELASRIRRAICAHLAAYGDASTTELDRMLIREVHDHADDLICTALRRHLRNLVDTGHIHRIAVDGQPRWKAGPGPVGGARAAPRQVMRLDTSVYMPSEHRVLRPGAMDFTRIPSLMLGHRQDYRSIAQ